MIAKHVPMRSLRKSDYAELVEYITDEQAKTERLGPIRFTNCEAATLAATVSEVLATQHINKRATGDKTYHLLIAFPPGEIPPADVLRTIEQRVCAVLGYSDHQRISAVHHDTDHLHIHIAINKIHPTRNTMHEPYQAYRALGEVCTKLETEFGLQRVNHTARRTLSEGRAADMEQHSGIESLVGWVRRECLADLNDARSWAALHDVMRRNSLELRVRANGFVIAAQDGTTVKASTVARELSRRALEARLGEFETPPTRDTHNSPRTYEKPPVRMRVDTVELYARYKATQLDLTTARAEALAKAKHRRDRAVEDAKRINRLRRAAVKIVDGKGINKRVLYSQAGAALRVSLVATHKAYARERERVYAAFHRKAWADWLRQEAVKGDAEALTALRSREATKGLKGNTLQAHGRSTPGPAPTQDAITKKGTIIFRAGRSAVRDDGDRLQVSRDTTGQGLHIALRLAMQKYGDRITVNGTAEFKAHIIRAAVDSQLPITFTDPGLERRRLALLPKETVHDHPNSPEPNRGRTDRRGVGVAVTGSAADQHAARSRATPAPGGRRTRGVDGRQAGLVGKPNIGRIGRVPPPQGQHRLRTLSELGVVRIAGGTEMLLPRDVPIDVDQQRPEPGNPLRRPVSWSGLITEAASAADKYIAERESKRASGFVIPKHYRYTEDDGTLAFAGIRHVDGHALVLLKRGDGIQVLPIDQATARRLLKVGIGDLVSVTRTGTVRTPKGRRR